MLFDIIFYRLRLCHQANQLKLPSRFCAMASLWIYIFHQYQDKLYPRMPSRSHRQRTVVSDVLSSREIPQPMSYASFHALDWSSYDWHKTFLDKEALQSRHPTLSPYGSFAKKQIPYRVLPWFHPMSYHHKCTHYHIYICDYIFELQFFVAIAHKLQHIQNLPF